MSQASLARHRKRYCPRAIHYHKKALARETAKLRSEFESSYKAELDSSLGQSLPEFLSTQAKQQAREVVQEVDYQSLLEYAKSLKR